MAQAQWSEFAKEYDNTVYSITKSPDKRQRILSHLTDGQNALIAGCGSAPYLQRNILDHFENIHLLATDWNQDMVDYSAQNFSHERLNHAQADSTNLGFQDEFDVVITTNSVIPETREDVKKMYQSFHNSLKDGGKFIAYLPSFDASIEILAENPELKDLIDVTNARVYDTSGWQSFHTSELIKKELTEAGFNNIQLHKVGIENEDELNELSNIYTQKIGEKIWTYFVQAEKKKV